MPQVREDDDADDSTEDEDRHLPLESDMSDEDEPPVDPCPHCGKSVHEEAEWCHHCGQYLSREDAPPGSVPLWMILGAAGVLVIVLFWMMGR